jgi:hypothetical protein
MADVSSRDGLRDGNGNDPKFPSGKYGSIDLRMRIVGGNLRLLHSPHTLSDLKELTAEAD